LWQSSGALFFPCWWALSCSIYAYKMGGDDRQAEWDASVAAQKVLVQEQKDRLQEKIAKLSADYQSGISLPFHAWKNKEGSERCDF